MFGFRSEPLNTLNHTADGLLCNRSNAEIWIRSERTEKSEERMIGKVKY